MKDFVVTSWCDFCFATNAAREPAVIEAVLGITIGSTDTPALRQLDMCEAHAKELDSIASVLARLGAPVDNPVAGGGKAHATLDTHSGGKGVEPCLLCDRSMARNYLAKHIWEVHIRQPRPVGPLVCPDCSYTDPRAASVGRHRVMHGYDPIEEAMAVYRDMQKPRSRKS